MKKIEDDNQKPLVEKFLDALGANEGKKNIFRFVLCIGMMPTELFDKGKRYLYHTLPGGFGLKLSGMLESSLSTPADISQLFGIPLPRIMKLVQSDSVWVKEPICYNNAGSLSPLTVSIFNPDSSMCASVLQGYNISMNQYNELKSPILQHWSIHRFVQVRLGRRFTRLHQPPI